MAPLVPPPPLLTLDQAKEVEQKILALPASNTILKPRHFQSLLSFLQIFPHGAKQAFTGRAFVNWALQTKLASSEEEAVKAGQALLDHRLAHHVNDDYEFENADHEYSFVSQEPKPVQDLHSQLGHIIAENKLHQGKLQLRTTTFWGAQRWINTYGVLDVTSKPKQLKLYKGFSAASAPYLTLQVEGKDKCYVTECMDCKDDWYCFNLRALKNERPYLVTLCADHSKRQEGWMQALTEVGVEFEKEDAGLDLSKIDSIYELKARKLNSKEVVTLDEYKGKVCLVVNVSSKCGLTPRDYPQLASLYEKYHDQGFEVLGFPTNNFASQEPGTEEEIQEFVKQYNVTFPMFEKIDVNGPNAHRVFRFLKGKLGGVMGSSIKWNFTKFLCDRNGVPVKRFGPPQTPNSFEDEIVALLQQQPKPAAAPAAAKKEEEENAVAIS